MENQNTNGGAPPIASAKGLAVPGKEASFYKQLGLKVSGAGSALTATVPPGFVAFVAEGAEAIDAQQKGLQSIGVIPSLWANTAKETRVAVFALAPAISPQLLQAKVGSLVRVISAGGIIPLPTGEWFDPQEIDAVHLEEFAEITSIGNLAEPPATATFSVPLSKYSLLGQGSKIEAQSLQSRPVLGKALLLAQASIIYAAPNTGKSLLVLYLILEAVRQGTIDPAKTFYINADDNSQGMAEKLSFLDEAGVHTLVPGFEGFTPPKLAVDLAAMVAEDCCEGVIIVIDTLKKFVDLMDKRLSSDFGGLCRQFVMKGGTIIALAHTRKNPSTAGKPVYGGTSDFMEDFDAACYLVPASEGASKGEKIVQFQFQKRRGPNVDEAYAYADEVDLTYFERLSSVRLVDDREVEEVRYADQTEADLQLIDAALACIRAGFIQKMELVREVARRQQVSRRIATQVVERYTGDDPQVHHWTYVVRDRGAKVFSVLSDDPQEVGET